MDKDSLKIKKDITFATAKPIIGQQNVQELTAKDFKKKTIFFIVN